MNATLQPNRHAVTEGARARVRRITGGIVIASIALAGTIAGYVAHGSTHKKSSAGVAAAPAATGVAVPSAPAAPSLLAPGESAPDQSQSISPPSQAPSSTQQPPAATSGAS
jgi:hypothetical protein